MRVILLLLLAGGAIVLMSQNWSPVLPLVFFGRETLPLPIAVWLSLGVLSGALTSLSWQLLYYRPQPRASLRDATRSPDPRSEPLRDYRQPLTPREIRRQRERNWESRPGTDWEAPPPPADDWNIEEPPEQPTAVQSPRTPPEDRDRPQPAPESLLRSEDAAKAAETDKVYDANYRILTTPPPTTEGDRPAEEADWVE